MVLARGTSRMGAVFDAFCFCHFSLENLPFLKFETAVTCYGAFGHNIRLCNGNVFIFCLRLSSVLKWTTVFTWKTEAEHPGICQSRPFLPLSKPRTHISVEAAPCVCMASLCCVIIMITCHETIRGDSDHVFFLRQRQCDCVSAGIHVIGGGA